MLSDKVLGVRRRNLPSPSVRRNGDIDVVGLDPSAFGLERRTIQDATELPHVTWPRVRDESGQTRSGEPLLPYILGHVSEQRGA
jgi:hypothetical protein